MWSESQVPDHLRTVLVIQSQYVLNLGAIYVVNCGPYECDLETHVNVRTKGGHSYTSSFSIIWIYTLRL